MRKKIIGLMSVFLSIVLVSGCNNGKVSTTSPADDTQSVVAEKPSVEPESPEPSEEVVSEVVSEEKPAADETTGDPKLAALEVTEEFAKANGLICLYRKGKLYSMGPYIPAQATYDYTIGHQVDEEKSELFTRDAMVDEYGFSCDVIVYGDVPEIIIGEDDEVRDYGGTFIRPITYDFAGYSPSLYKDEVNGFVHILKYLNHFKPVTLKAKDAQSVEILDADGNIVDFTDWPSCFEPYGQYTVTWYEGMSYNEHEMWAYSKVYFPNVDKTLNYDPNFIMTKEGYRIIDFSTYAPGIYGTEEMMPFKLE